MRVDAISKGEYTNFKGIGSKAGEIIEKAAATLPTKTSLNRKTISVELHNALVKLTAYRVALLFTAISGFLGFKTADRISDKASEDFANALQAVDIDTTAEIEIADINHDGSTDLILQKKDGTKMVLDFKNTDVLMESNGFKKVE